MLEEIIGKVYNQAVDLINFIEEMGSWRDFDQLRALAENLKKSLEELIECIDQGECF